MTLNKWIPEKPVDEDPLLCPLCHRKKKAEYPTCWQCYNELGNFKKEDTLDNEDWHCKYIKGNKCILDGNYCNSKNQEGYSCYEMK